MARRCIFCLTRKDDSAFSEEHVFPRAIGGSFVIHTVCATCNSSLGTSVDAALTDHVFIQMRRSMYGLAGNSGVVPDPLEKGTLANAPHIEVRDLVTSAPGPLRVMQKVKNETQPDGSKHVSAIFDARDEAGLIKAMDKVLQRSGLPPMTADALRPHVKHVQDPSPMVEVRVDVDCVRYKPALLKIAYELAATWLGDTYLTDPCAVEIQRTLQAADPAKVGPPSQCCGRIGLQDKNEAQKQGAQPNEHLACLAAIDGALVMLVYIFDVFEAIVTMSNEPSRYHDFRNRVLVVDPGTRSYKES